MIPGSRDRLNVGGGLLFVYCTAELVGMGKCLFSIRVSLYVSEHVRRVTHLCVSWLRGFSQVAKVMRSARPSISIVHCACRSRYRVWMLKTFSVEHV